jgi:anhydro-N-acetylmuramic acid kinase
VITARPGHAADLPSAYGGLMSGTSLDGVDAVAVTFPVDALPRVVGHVHQPYDDALRSELLALNREGPDELHRAYLAANAVSRAYAKAVTALRSTPGLEGLRLEALGAHGQTVRHRPGAVDGTGYSSQLLNGSLLAGLQEPRRGRRGSGCTPGASLPCRLVRC